MMTKGKLALRCYTRRANLSGIWRGKIHDPPLRHPRVLVFDTETTNDEYQNFKIGFFQIYQDGYIQHEGLFYDLSMLGEDEALTVRKFVQKTGIPTYTLGDFIEKAFYPEIYELHTLCIGYNLPFDISRIAQKAAKSRGWNRGGFTFTLSSDSFKPRIVIKQLGAAYSFKLQSMKKNQKEDQKRTYFPGYFFDAQRLAEILLQERHISLERAAEKLRTTTRKIKGIEHGRVTGEYILYLINDVVVTFEVYMRLIEELDLYQIQAPLTKIYSSASLGKFALKQLGIHAPGLAYGDNGYEILGHLMTAYYGGRTECRIRKKPTRATVLDFTSMYPTVTMLMGLWSFITAGSIETEVVTEEIRELLSQLDLAYLQNPDNWKQFTVLVKIKPNGDVLPVRMDYKGDGESFNVGINHLTSEIPLWYALPDVIASCILTQ